MKSEYRGFLAEPDKTHCLESLVFGKSPAHSICIRRAVFVWVPGARTPHAGEYAEFFVFVAGKRGRARSENMENSLPFIRNSY